MRFEEILSTVRRDYPDLRFRVGKKFMFRPPRTVVYAREADFNRIDSGNDYGDDGENDENNDGGGDLIGVGNEQKYYTLQLLHEVGHAVLGHEDFGADIERVKMERAAWEQARELCKRYGVEYDEDFVEGELDTYRDWLEKRSRCKVCGLARYQDEGGVYHCPFCENITPRQGRENLI